MPVWCFRHAALVQWDTLSEHWYFWCSVTCLSVCLFFFARESWERQISLSLTLSLFAILYLNPHTHTHSMHVTARVYVSVCRGVYVLWCTPVSVWLTTWSFSPPGPWAHQRSSGLWPRGLLGSQRRPAGAGITGPLLQEIENTEPGSDTSRLRTDAICRA